MGFKQIILKTINRFVLKRPKRVYLVPHNNGRTDKYDLLNYSADNILSLLNYAKSDERLDGYSFFVECYSETRLPLLKETIKNWKIKIIPVLSDQTEEHSVKNKKTWLHNLFLRYSCKTWVTCTPFSGFSDKIKCQTLICMSYSTPLKSGVSKGRYHLFYLDHFLETSLLTASIHSAQYDNDLSGCPILGFPRNDNLFNCRNKSIIEKWIKAKTDVAYSKLIVYAPTYRDYDNAYNSSNALGYINSSEELEDFLDKNKILLITKFHPLQDLTNIVNTPHVISYDKTFDFTLYDLLAISDMLISDYSSVIHDYILTGKPIVIDSFDYDTYLKTRGFAFEPIDYILPNKPCKDFESLTNCILEEFDSNTRSKKYYEVQSMFHKYIDFNSCNRVWSFFADLLNKNGK